MGCAVRLIIVLLCHPYVYAYYAANHIGWKITDISILVSVEDTDIIVFCSSTVPYSQLNVVKTLLVVCV